MQATNSLSNLNVLKISILIFLITSIVDTTSLFGQSAIKNAEKKPHHFAIYYDPFMIIKKQLAFSFEAFNKTGSIFINHSSLISHDSIATTADTTLYDKYSYITDIRFQKNICSIFQYFWLYAGPYAEYKYSATIKNENYTNQLSRFTAGMFIGLRKETKKRIVLTTYFGGGYSYSLVKSFTDESPPTSYMNIVPKFGFKIGYLL